MEAFAKYVHWSDGYCVWFAVMYGDGTWEKFELPFSGWYIGRQSISVKQFMNLRVLTQKKCTKEQTKKYVQQKIEEGKRLEESA